MKIEWSQFKSFVSNRKLDMLMLEDENHYHLFASEDGFAAECDVDKNPSDTTELDDFENNYKSACNPKKINIVTPSTPLNLHELKPYGICHKHINASECIFDITLSNKVGTDYTYSCTAIPSFYDCITNADGEVKDGVYSANPNNSTLDAFEGVLPDGDYMLIKPVNIDFKLPFIDGVDYFNLWGAYISSKDYGEDDLGRMQIVDLDGLGVGAGWYSAEEFEAMGSEFILKEYDECWIQHADKRTLIETPDHAPGEVPCGFYLRIKYYPKDVTKTDIKIWIDYVLTIKD
jgi:hypothetical protein